MNQRQVFAIIPAAGQSRRMGRLKQLMPYGEDTMIETLIGAVLESPLDGLIIVANKRVSKHLGGEMPERCFVVLNDDPKSDMLESVQIGLDFLIDRFETHDDDGVMILLADQPQVTAGVISTCAESFRLPRRPPGILIATYRGRRGHPAVFTFELLEELDDMNADQGLNELARAHPEAVRELPITSCSMPIDVNTPEDYDRLKIIPFRK
ncbi:MAG: NTP transferase domain-containing protein [Phycisphaerae bacterium]